MSESCTVPREESTAQKSKAFKLQVEEEEDDSEVVEAEVGAVEYILERNIERGRRDNAAGLCAEP